MAFFKQAIATFGYTPIIVLTILRNTKIPAFLQRSRGIWFWNENEVKEDEEVDYVSPVSQKLDIT